MAHALGRDVFVMVQKGTDLPADLKGAHYLEYDTRKLADATQKLKAQLKAWKADSHTRVTGVEALFR
jgi:hypothetical protein